MRIVAKRIEQLRAWVRRRRRRSSVSHGVVLMYHRVATPRHDPWRLSVSPETFESQMRALREDFDVLPLTELRSNLRVGRRSRPVAALTFDDGYRDNLTVAKAILERYAMPATVFVSTGFVGRTDGFWWDRLSQAVLGDQPLPERFVVDGPSLGFEYADSALSDRSSRGRRARTRLHDRLWTWLCDQTDADKERVLEQLERWCGRSPAADLDGRPMTVQELRQLVAGGLMDVGAHTVTHPRLSQLPAAAQAAEIERSLAGCREILGRRPVAFSYPNGDYTPESVELVRRAGFALACDSRADLVWAGDDALRVPRISVQNESGSALLRRLRWFWLA